MLLAHVFLWCWHWLQSWLEKVPNRIVYLGNLEYWSLYYACFLLASCWLTQLSQLGLAQTLLLLYGIPLFRWGKIFLFCLFFWLEDFMELRQVIAGPFCHSQSWISTGHLEYSL